MRMLRTIRTNQIKNTLIRNISYGKKHVFIVYVQEPTHRMRNTYKNEKKKKKQTHTHTKHYSVFDEHKPI